jgi:signal transduction histidine kinase
VNLVRLYGQDRQTNELLDELDVELRSIKQITENLIAFSDDGDGRLEEVDLGGIVMGFVKLIKQNAEERGIAIAYSAALGGAVAVRANRGEMRQVPLNLYRNGYEAMPDGGSIRITLEKAFSKGAEAARPGFRDSGPGIEAENTRDLYGIVKKLGGTMRL